MPSQKNHTLGYFFFAIACFVAFLYLQFPYSILLNRLISKIEPQLSPDRSIRIEAKNLTPYFVTGISLHNFKLKQSDQTLFEADKLNIRLRLLPLFVKTQSVAWSAKAYDGALSGTLGKKKSEVFGKISLQRVNLQKASYISQHTGLPLSGILNGNSDFLIHPSKPQDSQINGDLLLEKGRLGPGKIYGFELANAFRLDDQNGPVKIKIGMDKGVITPSIKLNNPDGRVELNGKINFTGNLRFSPLDLQLTFGLGEKMKEQIPAFVFTLPDLQQAANGDGTYSFRIRGTMQRTLFTPFKRG